MMFQVRIKITWNICAALQHVLKETSESVRPRGKLISEPSGDNFHFRIEGILEAPISLVDGGVRWRYPEFLFMTYV